jgi:hypothetical protein
MLIDHTHRRWIAATAVMTAAAAVLYLPYARRADAVSGGSWPGLAYGVAGFSLMVYAGLLGARKKVPVWRLGRAQTWMRGHLWLGLASFPLILLHAGLSLGSGLTLVLMLLLIVVIASGSWGAWLQHTMPRRMMRELPMETIYEQIEHVRAQLVMEADAIVTAACGKLEVETIVPTARTRGSAGTPGEPQTAAAALATIDRVDAEESAPLREFYRHELRPFLERPKGDHPLSDASRATARFEKLRALMPPAFRGAIADFENICEEERQLRRQSRMHVVLHGWQLVHVPLSIALLVLAIVHVIMALRF